MGGCEQCARASGSRASTVQTSGPRGPRPTHRETPMGRQADCPVPMQLPLAGGGARQPWAARPGTGLTSDDLADWGLHGTPLQVPHHRIGDPGEVAHVPAPHATGCPESEGGMWMTAGLRPHLPGLPRSLTCGTQGTCPTSTGQQRGSKPTLPTCPCEALSVSAAWRGRPAAPLTRLQPPPLPEQSRA